MKGAHIELFLSRMPHPLMEWNIDFYWCFDPEPESAILCILPTILYVQPKGLGVFSAQLSINGPPVITRDILWAEVLVANYLWKILEA